jgi:hypothetical protein
MRANIEARKLARPTRSNERDSALVLRSSWGSDIPIAPFSKDVFVGDFVGIVKFSRDNGGVRDRIYSEPENARGVRFDRVRRTG